MATLVGAQTAPLSLQGEQRCFQNIERISRAEFMKSLLKRLSARPYLLVGNLATQLEDYIEALVGILESLTPHSPREPLKVCTTLSDLRKKSYTPPLVLQ